MILSLSELLNVSYGVRVHNKQPKAKHGKMREVTASLQEDKRWVGEYLGELGSLQSQESYPGKGCGLWPSTNKKSSNHSSLPMIEHLSLDASLRGRDGRLIHTMVVQIVGRTRSDIDVGRQNFDSRPFWMFATGSLARFWVSARPRTTVARSVLLILFTVCSKRLWPSSTRIATKKRLRTFECTYYIVVFCQPLQVNHFLCRTFNVNFVYNVYYILF